MPQRFALHGIVGAGVKLAMHNMLSGGSRSRGKPDLLFMAAADDKMPDRFVLSRLQNIRLCLYSKDRHWLPLWM